MASNIRNVAIVAHVDHGKTTLVDQLLKRSGTLSKRDEGVTRVMDSNDIERERGITILAKNTSIEWKDHRINIVDTPGHADFGGEVERILSMVDRVLLLVDAVDGPMPQTRFVTQKALARGLNPIVIVNKLDRDGARPDWVIDQTFDMFDKLGANDTQLDFPTLYCSAIQGWMRYQPDGEDHDITEILDRIIAEVPPPEVDAEGPLQMQISSLDYSSYVGAIGIGRITRGTIKVNQNVAVLDRDSHRRPGRVLEILAFHGLVREKRPSASAGDIIAISGIDGLRISDTLCDPEHPEAMPQLVVDEPTVSVNFQVSDSPFVGRAGKFVTSRQIRERLEEELIHNVALRVEDGSDPTTFKVSGRGELHLAILMENMRREGYEFSVGRPEVITREIDGERCEPFESLTVDVPAEHQGAVMEKLGTRRGRLLQMVPDGRGRVRLDYDIPARGLIGFRTEFLTATSGAGLMSHNFEAYRPIIKESLAERVNGVLIAAGTGKALGYSLFNLQERGRLFVKPGDEVYEGMLVGIHSRSNDLVVNPLKGKQLTNVRASGTDENIILTPPVVFDLEQAMEFIADDELVEITPTSIRLRKRLLKEPDRRREARGQTATAG